MQVIDLEILIPASPDFIWGVLGDISRAPGWREGVTGVSFLTTQRDGKGARWRYSRKRGSDIIIEAAAWYDTVGYEYTVVDGAGLGENQGRIRLTEVTDGTVVRWTLNYETAGVFGGLRNAMRFKGKTTKRMQASLRNLHQMVQQEAGGVSTHEARASVREAPDAQERSNYQPRHPSSFTENADNSRDDLQPLDTPPPLSFAQPWSDDADGDTKPNPVALGGNGSLDMQLQRDEIDAATQPVEPAVIDIAPETALIDSTPEPRAIDSPPQPAADIDEVDEPALFASRPPTSQPPDSAALSVFEVFGLRRPSDIEADFAEAHAGPPVRRNAGRDAHVRRRRCRIASGPRDAAGCQRAEAKRRRSQSSYRGQGGAANNGDSQYRCVRAADHPRKVGKSGEVGG